jgi:hypothetical protein
MRTRADVQMKRMSGRTFSSKNIRYDIPVERNLLYTSRLLQVQPACTGLLQTLSSQPSGDLGFKLQITERQVIHQAINSLQRHPLEGRAIV